MKLNVFVIASFALVACGGKAKKATDQPPPDPDLGSEVEPIDEPEPEPEPEPPPPQRWSARAELAPVKGAKVKARVVSFAQTEGAGADIAGDAPFDGLKAGTYHLVVHASPECGKNATKAGPVLAATAGVALTLVVVKGAPAALEDSGVGLTLDGDDSIVGHTLVLHEDKKGKPGKALACGPIVADGDDGADGAVD